ncbi:hypothetical protein [Leptospira mayottensis]|uniref:Uncharacterized protein n=2 Tax=Leptospira mayottensis TaxID=1137606 RepID=A0AA87MSJ7_9LEPT|nr:hypothetical protein [Leptospira mayottensis]AXR61228.1 hypothetical protein DQM68_11605 [Leptospira mayottensis]AXR65517.1 hypothetical protein DQM28_16140 [Leptospira mayottensis]AXR68795.1 hypothetical protein DPV73_13060 [Leptospira mayottensis]AZQ02335.1 hypothetical protein LEP1GSC190_10105 [Leptospira mayottensis 200901116]EKS01021.1 hypothetical protein LEP1GSC125_2016 [Leptospira mayottensis 200901122]
MKVNVKLFSPFKLESIRIFSLLEYLKLSSGMFVIQSKSRILLGKNLKSGPMGNGGDLRS